MLDVFLSCALGLFPGFGGLWMPYLSIYCHVGVLFGLWPFLFPFPLVVLQIEPRDSHMTGKHSTLLSLWDFRLEPSGLTLT